MLSLLATVASWVPVAVVGLAGLWHLSATDRLAAALDTHALFPTLLTRPIAGLVALGELGLGSIAAVALLTSNDDLSRIAFGFLCGLYLVYSAYTIALLKVRPTAVCGCWVHDHEINRWVPLRSAALALMSGCAVAIQERALPEHDVLLVNATVACLSAATFTTILLVLPGALVDPQRATSGVRPTSLVERP